MKRFFVDLLCNFWLGRATSEQLENDGSNRVHVAFLIDFGIFLAEMAVQKILHFMLRLIDFTVSLVG